MFPGGIALWVVVGLAWGDWVTPGALPRYGGDAVAAVLVLAIYNTTLTQFLWIGGLAAVPDLTRGMYLFFLKPALAALIALAFLGEVPTWLQGLAIAVITGCVGLEAVWDKMVRRIAAGRAAA
jgi:drug/metabolite transporter (DMT)-like permease